MPGWGLLRGEERGSAPVLLASTLVHQGGASIRREERDGGLSEALSLWCFSTRVKNHTCGSVCLSLWLK
ncbi:hypothetical protein CgunFtcFv8_006499 [Champsocephalus gunnari]|uniref:Uncharacterized protein n=1 Tax=Champsocephalus gunnari TaxID=52237 RepID=A0AAN8BXE0_CHAGU|nr:hypothetical protein CgunFtcFv8_006499 [Champsocephalus gunnari]